ncbi:holin family protein [Azoarcus sp. L1K30]|uniref:holin family protein n=1 Tax=Azoarcus sp. L1K30 TaxID=2820277 RepID=UPI001B8144F4|nr:holin family protein [Azoarcus sp. L1K30]MBR0568350.1 holin family protein [Azoarcus sp. L1K30]
MWQILAPMIGNILDKLIPDPAQAADAKLKMLELAQKGELAALDAEMQIALGQIETNKVEAAQTDMFRGGWRPATGWACVGGLVYQFFLQPILPWVVSIAGGSVPPLPPIDNDTLFVLLTGMLGLGGLRTVERVKGKA